MKLTRELFLELANKAYGEFDHKSDSPSVNIANLLFKWTRHVLKTMPYTEYLQTDHWFEFRTLALSRYGHKCDLCNKSARLHVHHRTYKRRGHELYEDVRILCEECHDTHHHVLDLPEPPVEEAYVPRRRYKSQVHEELMRQLNSSKTHEEAISVLRKLQELP